MLSSGPHAYTPGPISSWFQRVPLSQSRTVLTANGCAILLGHKTPLLPLTARTQQLELISADPARGTNRGAVINPRNLPTIPETPSWNRPQPAQPHRCLRLRSAA